MKRVLNFMLLLTLAVIAVSCDNKGKSIFTPQSSGRPYEVMVVADDAFWIDADSALYNVLDSDVPGLPQPERSFRISRIRPDYFDRTMRLFRNIIMVDMQDIYTQTKLKFSRNVYAAPQVVMTIQTPSREAFDAYVTEHGQTIIDFFTKVEMNREIVLLKEKHNPTISQYVQEIFGADIYMPTEMKSFKQGKNFFWASTELNDMNFVMYSYPFRSNDTFTKEFFIHKRDSVLEVNLPGSQAGMYMQTAHPEIVETSAQTIHGEYVFEARGLWEMKNDAMGGPFVSQVRIDKANGRVVVVEGFVYNPGKLKRDQIRKLNAALYTLQLPNVHQLDEIVLTSDITEEEQKTEPTATQTK